jgi:hypothetical protein
MARNRLMLDKELINREQYNKFRDMLISSDDEMKDLACRVIEELWTVIKVKEAINDLKEKQ